METQFGLKALQSRDAGAYNLMDGFDFRRSPARRLFCDLSRRGDFAGHYLFWRFSHLARRSSCRRSHLFRTHDARVNFFRLGLHQAFQKLAEGHVQAELGLKLRSAPIHAISTLSGRWLNTLNKNSQIDHFVRYRSWHRGMCNVRLGHNQCPHQANKSISGRDAQRFGPTLAMVAFGERVE